jgi:hypothetical protein
MMFQTLVYIIVLVNLGLTIELWRRAARRPGKFKKKFLKRLFDSKPITPKHQPPPPLTEGYARGERVLQFFSDFGHFANVVNWWLVDESRWRLQELPETELGLPIAFSGYEPQGPTFGRSYAVFYNQVRLGALEVAPRFSYSADDPRVTTYIHLDHVRLLSFETIRDFFAAIALHTCDFSPGTKEYVEAQQAIDRAMTEVLWQISQVSRFGFDYGEDHGEINLRLDGTATWYVERRDCEAFRKGAWQA